VALGCTVNIPVDQRHDHGGDTEDLGSKSECRCRNAPDLSRIQSCDRESWEKPEGLGPVGFGTGGERHVRSWPGRQVIARFVSRAVAALSRTSCRCHRLSA
jgi:hypothetical protein